MRLFMAVVIGGTPVPRRRRNSASSTRDYGVKRLRKGFRPRRNATGPTLAPVPRRSSRLHLPLRAGERERGYGHDSGQRRGGTAALAGNDRFKADNIAGGWASLPGCNHRYLLLGPGSNLRSRLGQKGRVPSLHKPQRARGTCVGRRDARYMVNRISIARKNMWRREVRRRRVAVAPQASAPAAQGGGYQGGGYLNTSAPLPFSVAPRSSS